ncbi:hypothetical protein AVEN_39405-1 [Araneus ventricosus]|uniref:DUF5641 domain-containing protein n=1 Tax=Araneus ventricosus TaxID=182803 RepID=A0A4Y2S4E2_ARAVE|nr:hypothetical protein AVEN_39405-1 [Araneus ventricosus]
MDLRNAHALKNHNTQQNIRIDDAVLIEGGNKSKLLWRLGRVIQGFPGRDGGVRSSLLKTSAGTLKRPVGSVWKVFDIVDGAPAVSGDVSGDVVYIWMLPITISVVVCTFLPTSALSPRISPQPSADPLIGLSETSMYAERICEYWF